MRDAHNKMSKRHGDPSYEDLKAQGYLTPAILNYVALLGWSPRGELAEQEVFSLEELVAAFDLAGVSKSPAIFDIEKLTHFNALYLRAMEPADFARAAEPYIRQSFDRNKVMNGLIRACEKRPVSFSTMEEIVNEIEQTLQNEMEREVSSAEIGELVMERLKKVDEVSYVRFASVYRQFKDINTFMRELNKLLEDK